MLSGEKILITGASGVVGLPIASELAKSRHAAEGNHRWGVQLQTVNLTGELTP